MTWRETPHDRLLSYRSILEWRDKENAPPFITEEMSPEDRELYLKQHGELSGKLWNEHYASLPEEVKQLFESKEHPRFHYLEEIWELRGEGAAKKYLLELQCHLESLGRTGLFMVTDSPFSDVRLGVLLDPPLTREELYNQVPHYFMGFEVLYYPPELKQLFANVDD